MKFIYCIILVIASSCVQSPKESKESKMDPNPVIKKKETVKDSISIKKLMFLTKAEAIDKYGTPFSEERFTLDDALGEFRITIINIYNQKERQSEAVVIDELTWEKDKKTWVTVWYEVQPEKSIPKEVYMWEKGTEF